MISVAHPVSIPQYRGQEDVANLSYINFMVQRFWLNWLSSN